jgi:hypothetical protein
VPRLFAANDFYQSGCELFVAGITSQQWLQIVFFQAEEAGPDFPIRREAQPVAMAAEWLGDRRYDPNLAATVGKRPSLGRFARISRLIDRDQLESILDAPKNLTA